jgi:hypothetical protein
MVETFSAGTDMIAQDTHRLTMQSEKIVEAIALMQWLTREQVVSLSRRGEAVIQLGEPASLFDRELVRLKLQHADHREMKRTG